MIKNKIISFLRIHKVTILFWIAVFIGTVVAINVSEWFYNTYFIDLLSDWIK